MKVESIYPFLELLVEDNETYSFPVTEIRKELLQLMLSLQEFEYFFKRAYRVIKHKYGVIMGNIFLQLLEVALEEIKYETIYDLSEEEYVEFIYRFIELLESAKITRIHRESPDYDVIKAMK